MRVTWLALLAAVGWTGPAAAQDTFQLEWWYNNAQVAAGSTVSVPKSSTATFDVYIHETGGTTLQTQKLSGFGVRATFGTVGVLSLAGTTPPSLNPDPGFEFPSRQDATSTYGQFAGFTLTDKSPDATGRIRLGSFQFQTAASGTTTLTAADLPGSQDWITGTLAELDASIVPYQVFVVPVPEPAAGLLLAAGGLALVRRRLFR